MVGATQQLTPLGAWLQLIQFRSALAILAHQPSPSPLAQQQPQSLAQPLVAILLFQASFNSVLSLPRSRSLFNLSICPSQRASSTSMSPSRSRPTTGSPLRSFHQS